MSRDYFDIEVDLSSKKLWLFDMDGTIYEEENLFDGTLDLLNEIKNQGGRYVFITNNSSRSITDYVNKVNQLGIAASEDNFFTSVQATSIWLEENFPNARIYCQGTKSLIEELKKAGHIITEKVEPVDVVLVGFDTEISTDKIRNTCEILSNQQVKYIATNPDWACPVSFGFIPDCASICEMIKHATNKWPQFIGKPEPVMVDMVRNKFGYTKEMTVVVGDRLYTDIMAGINAEVDTICVLTGEATTSEIMDGSIKPSYTFGSVSDIYKNIINNIDYRNVISARSKKVNRDLERCEKCLKDNNIRLTEKLLNALIIEYQLNLEQFESVSEGLKQTMDKLVWAIKML